MDTQLRNALQPTPAGARLDLSLYFREDQEGQKASMVLRNADGEELCDLFMDSPQGLNLPLSACNTWAFAALDISERSPWDGERVPLLVD
jgi:hypothetical protein